MALDLHDPLPGTTIAGRYRILSRIAAGGMRLVYRAEQVFLKHQVAIKRLNPELTGHGTAVERFTREARAAVRIDHPNACRVLDCGISEDGAVYIAMELLEGQLLTDRIAEMAILPLSEIVEIGAQLCDALERAHALGIIHRDLKPDNVMLVARPDGKGDLLFLERFRPETGCGPRGRRDCWACERPSLRAALEAVRQVARRAPSAGPDAAP